MVFSSTLQVTEQRFRPTSGRCMADVRVLLEELKQSQDELRKEALFFSKDWQPISVEAALMETRQENTYAKMSTEAYA